ncbi:DCA15 factor, partial [Aegithalos caudatus]|nr:DCA15 factor [Aegithalos caudatus]
QLSGQLSPRLFRKLPPRVCVTLKSIVDEEFLWAGHIFLGFSKCGRYVLSYTSSSGDDDFSFYLYHLYWWEFNVHSKLRLVRQVRLFQDEEIYSDLYLTVCEWPGDSDKVIVFGFNTRSAPGLQVNMMLMSDENHWDIYVSAVAVPPPRHCPACRQAAAPLPGSPPGEPHPPGTSPEPGYVNYTKLRYVLEPGEPPEDLEDDKISLPFVVTDLSGRSLRPLRDRATAQGQYLTVEQLTLDFEYVINEVIRNDAAWSRQFCSFSDYDIVILEVCPETNQVVINIGLLLLAFPSPDEEGQLRPRTYHTSLKVAWDLNSGTFTTVGVGDLTEVKGQTSGSVWSSYRKGCVDTVMRWLVPEGPGRGVHRMTNEALHKGCSLKVLADNERYTWIVL